MNELLKPWAAMQKQLIQAHKANVEMMIKTMDQGSFKGAAEAAKTLSDSQIEAWEKWLAMWGPKE